MKIHGTAKGGALSKKDFGVAFGGGAAPCVDATYTNLPTETLTARALDTSRWGQGFQATSGNNIFTKTIKSVTVKLDNDDRSPDETISARIRTVSTGAIVGTFGELDATTLTDTPTEYTFDTNEVTLSSGDLITVEYPISTGNGVAVSVSASSVSNASTLAAYNPSLTNWSAWDHWVWMKIVYCE